MSTRGSLTRVRGGIARIISDTAFCEECGAVGVTVYAPTRGQYGDEVGPRQCADCTRMADRWAVS